MDPVTIIIVPGFVGGVVIALVFFWLQRRPGDSSIAPRFRDDVTTDVINMASIKVAGIGGLGLVAMAVAVALDVPRIGQTVLVGLGLGVVLAVGLIARRRRSGAMPSSGERPGANSTLAIDEQTPAPPEVLDGRRGEPRRPMTAVAAP
jgi:hypothetical protein